ncbi:MAG: ATP-dependent DNA ligase [Candidatus Rokubacteria bacterium]|nr:ATP-dependent DNA ligase [Candidatus Rokubacteria bacterium]
MTIGDIAGLTRALAGTPRRLEKVALVAEFLRGLTPDEIPWAVAFLAGRPLPPSDPRVLSVSAATLARLGDVPPRSAGSTLTILDVARAWSAVADAAGAGSRAAKTAILRDLVAAASPEERRVLLAILSGEMRTGVHDGLIQEALARAASVTPELVRRAGLLLSDPSEVARVALADGEAGLRAVGVQLFVPLLSMLAEPAEDLRRVLAEHGGRTAFEVKYDGARIQVHRRGEVVQIWSRRLTDVTTSLPELVEVARHELAATAMILEGEVVAVAPDGRPLPFQDLMRRFRRVHALDAVARQVPVRLYLFDCLYADGATFVDRPYAERWAALTEITRGRHLAERRIIGDLAAAEAFLREALAAGHEGLMAKALDSPYTPGVRGRRWFKVKRADRLDCVILAADRGSGRRRGWLSNYHLAVRGEAGGFAEVGKTFKGLTDAEFGEMTVRLWALSVEDDGYTVRVRPEVVVEVAYNEIQPSPRYPSGFALRFARITRIREDKRPEDADTLAALRARYAQQSKSKGGRG